MPRDEILFPMLFSESLGFWFLSVVFVVIVDVLICFCLFVFLHKIVSNVDIASNTNVVTILLNEQMNK